MSQPTKIGTVAIILMPNDQQECWVDTFSDEREIVALEKAIEAGATDPLEVVYEYRAQKEQEDEEFGEYVEDLLSQPALRPDIKEHGVAWLKSKMKIEKFQKQERDAADVIANYALSKYHENPHTLDFVISGSGVQVRVRIFKLSQYNRVAAA